MQGLEGGRGPLADSGRNRTRREETSNGTFDRRAGDIYNERGHTYDRMHGSGFVDTDTWNGPFTAPGARPPPPYDDDSRRRGDIYRLTLTGRRFCFPLAGGSSRAGAMAGVCFLTGEGRLARVA